MSEHTKTEPAKSEEWAGPFSVRCSHEVAKTSSGDTGTRSVFLNHGAEDEHLLTFSRAPLYLRHIPPEVAADDQLIVENVSFSDIVRAGGRFTLLPGEEAPKPFEGDPEKAKISDLRDLAKELGLDAEGDKDELLARIDGYFRAHGEIFLKAERVQ